MLKCKLILLLGLLSGLVSYAQQKVEFSKLPDWVWGEYIYSNGQWLMDLHKDFILLSGQLSGYVAEASITDGVYCLNVKDYNPNKRDKTLWMKMINTDTISVSMDNKRFVQLIKPHDKSFTHLDLETYLAPKMGKWYDAVTGELYAELGKDSVYLDGEMFAYTYVVKHGGTVQLNLSGKRYGRLMQFEEYTPIYAKIRASGKSSNICKRIAEMPYQVSNEFSEIPDNLTGTFYTTDGKNTRFELKPYELIMGADTIPLAKLRLRDESVLLKFTLNNRMTDVHLSAYNGDYIQYKQENNVPVILKRRQNLPDGIEMNNPFKGKWYSTTDGSIIQLGAESFTGKATGNRNFDQVLFNGSAFEFRKKGKIHAKVTSFKGGYVEVFAKKGIVLMKKNIQDPDYVKIAELPKEYIGDWYLPSKGFAYGINNSYLAYNKRFYRVDSISYSNQKYQLHASYTDTICHYNKSGDYVCEVVHDIKHLALQSIAGNGIMIKDLDAKSAPVKYSLKMEDCTPDRPEMKQYGKAVLMGHIDNSEDLKNRSLNIYSKDVLFNSQTKFTSKVDDNGFFKFEIPLLNSKTVWSQIGTNKELILTPNDTLLVCTNAKNLTSITHWNMMGPNVALMKETSTLYSDWNKRQRKSYLELKDHFELSPENYSLFMDSIFQADLAWLHTINAQNKYSEASVEYFINLIKINNWDNRMRFRWMRKRAGGYAQFEEHPTYFSFLDSIPFSDPDLWFHNDFQNLVHEVFIHDKKITRPHVQAKELFTRIMEQDTTLSLVSKEILQKQLDNGNQKPDPEEMDSIRAIIKRNERIFSALKRESMAEGTKSITFQDNGLILNDVFACNDFYIQLQAGRDIEKGWEELKQKVMHDAYLQHMKVPYEKELSIRNKELPEYCLMNYPAKTSGDKFLKALAEKHAGYVVYIDFWAPWCAPCRKEMESVPKIKKALNGQPIQFVYLCGSGGKEAQASCIKRYNIAGDHYYLAPETYEEITGKFNITGIPTFMIMDKEGNIVEQKAPRPSSGKVLINSLKKYAEEDASETVSCLVQ